MTAQRHLTMVGASGEALDAKEAKEAAGRGGGEATYSAEIVRGMMRARMEASGITLAKVAQEVGYRQSTLSLWLSGNYGANEAHVAEAVLRWLKIDNARAMSLTAGELQVTPVWTAVREVLSAAHEHSMMGLVVGEPGCGKTTASRAYVKEHPRVAWVVRADAAARGAAALARLLWVTVSRSAFGASQTARAMAALVDRLKGSKGLIVVDEAQELTRSGLEVLRRLYDEGEVGVVLVGNPRIQRRLMAAGDTYAQIRDRVDIARNVDGLMTADDIERVMLGFRIRIEDGALDLLTGAGSLRRAVQLLKIAGRGKVGGTITEGHIREALRVARVDGEVGGNG